MPTAEVCGKPRKRDGGPCQYRPGPSCPHHSPGGQGNHGKGRPSDYTEEIATTICDRIAEGESLRGICRDDDMPSKVSVWRWLNKHPDFCSRYAQARDAQAEGYGEEIVALADEIPTHASHEEISRAKLRVDARKWVASRLLPGKYGRTSKVEHSGPEGGPIEHRVEDARDKLKGELEEIMQRRAEVAARN